MGDAPRSGHGTVRIENLGEGAVEVLLEGLQLRVEEGPDAGRAVTSLISRVRVGSAPENDLILTDPAVSGSHAELQVDGERLVLRDLDSTNGTFVGDLKVTEVELEPGRSFRVGTSVVAVAPRTESRKAMVLDEPRLGELIGASEAMRRLFSLLRTLAPTPATILLGGEPGTGKELAARTVHTLSGRKGKMVVYDAASADPSLIRSDLFGHKKGAFTGAAEARDGAFRRAHGGTLFIDEVGELPMDLQPRLLRALERREVIPVGGDDAVAVDVRVVAATNRDLKAMVAEGTFRADLYHRLAVVPLTMPPLRDRLGDLDHLVTHLVAALGLTCSFGDDARAAMRAHPWPGNVRELRNVVERAGYLAAGREVAAADLLLEEASAGEVPATTIAAVEKQMILASMKRHEGDKNAVAAELGISIGTLRRRLKEYEDEG